MSSTTTNGAAQSLSRDKVLAELRREMAEFTSDPDPWLTAPHSMLGGRTPLEIACINEDGKEIVLNLIGLIKSGSFT